MTIPPIPPAPLAPLALYKQWITYRLQPGSKPGKMDKIPTSWRTGTGINLTNAVNFGTYDEAAAGANSHGQGIAFVFTDADPFWFLDIDNAFAPGPDGAEGVWSPLATELYHSLQGAAWEVSQSGRGLHAFGSGPLPDHRCDVKSLGLGLYHTQRFVALTLACYEGGSASAILPAINDIAATYFPPHPESKKGDEWRDEPVPEWSGPEDDDALIAAALASRGAAAALGSGDPSKAVVTFADLWTANADVLAAKWPANDGGSVYGESEADAALASHLAFWTGRHHGRIETLMRRSALYREKWDRGSPYLVPTILRACAVTSAVLQRDPVAPAIAAAVAGAATDGLYVPPASYPEYFADCCYVTTAGAIYTPSHGLVTSSAFDTIYGGKIFITDATGETKNLTKSAWEAFRLCQCWRPPIAHDLCFRPEASPGALVTIEGRNYVNSYVPIETERRTGDPGRFFDFLARIIPDERDRAILTSYMAGVVQNPGVKAQWWPVLQGAEGNGKTTLLRVMSHAVGHRYTHLVNPDATAKTGGQFNAWVQGNLFCGIEEIYVAKRRDFLESFKATVTNDRLALEGKGTAQFTGDNRCNGMMLTNHRDGVPITIDTRRYAVFYTAQQSEADIIRDGMGGDYFPRLYDWLSTGGYAIVNEWLHTWPPVAEFNPCGMGPARARAPKTGSHVAAVHWSFGLVEQEVLEAIEEEQQGFRRGWVSSHYLALLLDRINVRVPRNKRYDLMRTLGYDYHPNMREGRCNAPIAPDGKKSRLYLKDGHLALNVTDHQQICDLYSAAQISPIERVA